MTSTQSNIAPSNRLSGTSLLGVTLVIGAVALVAGCAATPPLAAPAAQAPRAASANLSDNDSGQPLMLAREGYLYVGGKFVSEKGKQYMSNQMYVEYRIPARQTHPYPIVMVHGASMSGVNFTGTPDGREGWAQYFVRRGYAVYVVDQVARGRSGYLPQVDGPQTFSSRQDSVRRFTGAEQYNQWPQAHLHTQWAGASGDAEDPVTEQLFASQLPAMKDLTKQEAFTRDGLVALVEKIGPSILLVHSQAGAIGWPVADARPELIKALIAIEPSGPPVHDLKERGAPNYFSDNPAMKLWGLGPLPLTYAPPVRNPKQLSFERNASAPSPDLAVCWKQKAPARQLPMLQKMPILVVTSEASYHAPYDHCTVEYLEQAGVRPTYIKLADIGIHGNSHMMMIEKNNLQIAGVLNRWLGRALPDDGAARQQ
jgi:pimeloyl-ACP methyl ester carboxylesterase